MAVDYEFRAASKPTPVTGRLELVKPARMRLEVRDEAVTVYLLHESGQWDVFPEEGKAFEYSPDTARLPKTAYEVFRELRLYAKYLSLSGGRREADGRVRLTLHPVQQVGDVSRLELVLEESSGRVREVQALAAGGTPVMALTMGPYDLDADLPESRFLPGPEVQALTPLTEREFLNPQD